MSCFGFHFRLDFHGSVLHNCKDLVLILKNIEVEKSVLLYALLPWWISLIVNYAYFGLCTAFISKILSLW